MKKDASAVEGAALDAGNIPLEPVAPVAPGAPGSVSVDPAREWSEPPAAVGALLRFPFPELEHVYTPEACMAWGVAMVPIAERYGWTAGKVFPWLSLIGASASLLLPTVAIIKAHAQPETAAPAGEKGPLATVTAIKSGAGTDTGDVDLQDPTKKNPPPRPVS